MIKSISVSPSLSMGLHGGSKRSYRVFPEPLLIGCVPGITVAPERKAPTRRSAHWHSMVECLHNSDRMPKAEGRLNSVLSWDPDRSQHRGTTRSPLLWPVDSVGNLSSHPPPPPLLTIARNLFGSSEYDFCRVCLSCLLCLFFWVYSRVYYHFIE